MTETPRIGHAPIPMRRVERGLLQQPGDFHWQVATDGSGKRALVLALPVPEREEDAWGLPRLLRYSRWTIDYKNLSGASWSWDGNEDQPTLSPSLHAVGEWHGWVRQGVLTEA